MNAWLTLTWEPLARHRWIFRTMAAYFVLACLICPLLPASWRMPEVGQLLMMVSLPWVVVLAAGLAHGYEGRLEGRASAFPSRKFTLPVRARTLAGAPLVLGTLLSACWPIFALCVLWPCGFEVALVWPAVVGAAFLAWTQALCWTPFPLPWLRLIVASLALPGLCLLSIVLYAVAQESVLPSVVLGATVPIAYVVAIRGVARAREGIGTAEPSLVAAPGRAGERAHRAPFATAAAAQSWLEWRRQGWLLLLVAGLGLAWGLLSVQLSEWALRAEGLPEGLPWMAEAIATFGVGWLAVSQMVLAPLTTSMLGTDLGRHTSRRGLEPSTFLLTLPITTPGVIRAKLLMGAKVVALTWASAFAVGLAWAAVRGHLPDMTDRLVSESGSRAAALGVLLGGLLLGAALTWLSLISGAWGGLLGRRSVAWVPMAVGFGSWLAIGFGGHWWVVYPGMRPLLVVGLSLLLAAKAAWVVWAVRRLRAHGLMTAVAASGWLLAWAALAVLVGVLACRFSGGGAALFAVVLLVLPLAAPLGAPLALDAARHR